MLKGLRKELKALPNTPKVLRSFGFTLGTVSLLAAGVLVLFSDTQRLHWVLAGLGAALAVLGLVAPRTLKSLYVPWMGLALVLGVLMTYILLTLVFFLVITPIGLLMRLFGRDPMRRTLARKAESYWIPKKHEAPARERLTRYY